MALKVVRGGLCSLLGLAGVLVAGVVCAQEEEAPVEESAKPRREALQLSLQGSLLDYQRQTVKPDPLPGVTMQPGEQESSATTFGMLGSGLGVGIGYAWPNVLLGVRAQLTAKTSSPAGGEDTKETLLDFFPRVEYLIDAGSARPYIAGLIGIQHSSSSSTSSTVIDFGGGNTASSVAFPLETSSTRFGFGAAFGVHAFLNHSVSLDPEVAVLYSTGSSTTTAQSTATTQPTTASLDASVSTLRFLLTLGLSGWIDTGGAPPAPPPREETTVTPAVAAAPVVVPEPEAPPLSADIHLPNHRRLYLQVSKDRTQQSVLVRLNEPRSSFALLNCNVVAITANGTSVPLAIRTHGEHYLTGRLPVRGLELLSAIVDSTIAVCGEEWQLGQESREQVQFFLKERRELVDDETDSGDSAQPTEAAPTPPVAAPPAPSAAPSAPSTAPSSKPSATPAAPSAAPPAAPAPAPAKPAAPKK